MKNIQKLPLYALALTALGCLVFTSGCGDDDEDLPAFQIGPFVFRADPQPLTGQVERVGMPAVNTVLISAGNKDTYNVSRPTDDILGDFVPDITANIDALHMALDDDLMGLGLTPCATGDCVNQGAPLIIPDVLQIDPNAPAGFPNGRRLEDPVIDVTLAVILLDLGVHPADTLAGVPVNPPANDLPFSANFPYLADPH